MRTREGVARIAFEKGSRRVISRLADSGSRRRPTDGGLRPRYHGHGERRGWGRRVAIVLVLLVGFGALACLATATADLAAESSFFEVKGVRVRGNVFVAEESIVERLGVIAGLNLLAIAPEQMAVGLRAHPRLRAVRVSRCLDRFIEITVEERMPVALIEAGNLVEVDAEGFVLPPVERGAIPDLPILTGVGSRLPTPGSCFEDPELRDALRIVSALAASDPGFLDMVSEIDLARSPVYRIYLLGRPQVLVAHAQGLTPAKLTGVRSVLEDLERRGRTNVEVDLRFEGQLVVRELKG